MYGFKQGTNPGGGGDTSSNIRYPGSARDTNLDPIGSKDLKSMKKGSFGSKIKEKFIRNA